MFQAPGAPIVPTRARVSVLAILAGVAGLASCREGLPTGDGGSHGPSLAISDAVHSGGNEHFFFLPPMVPQPGYAAPPDPALAPVVTVCAWDGAACSTLVARFTATEGTGAEVVRYDASGELYHVNWHTDQCVTGACTLDPATTYRLRVFVGALELGFADLDVVSNGSQLRNVQTGEYIGLVNGRTLPVKFRIEVGAVAVLDPGESAPIDAGGGLVTTADGQVGLEFPSGALAAPTAITVDAVDSPPEAPDALAPIVDLGPDGTTFSEPVTLTMAYDPSTLPEDLPDSLLVIYSFDGTGWDVVDGSVVDATDHTVSAEITHFSFYMISVRPTDASFQVTPTTIVVGDTTSITASVSSCYKPRFRPTVCSAVRNAWIYWGSTNWGALTVDAQPSLTDGWGHATGRFTGRRPGIADVSARIAQTSSLPLRITVLGQLGFAPADREIVAGWSVGQDVTLSVPDLTAVDVSLTNQNGFLVVGESGTSNYTYGGQTGTYSIAAGATSKPLVIAGLAGIGVDTLIASAPGYVPDTTVVTLVQGMMRVDGWPTQLAFGDSAALTLTVASQEGAPGNLASPIEVAITPSAGLTFTDGQAPITAVPVPQRTSSTFYVKATGAGEQSVTLSHRDYLDYTNTLTVSAPPTIGYSTNTVTIQVQQGATNTAEIQITNTGGGTLTGLTAGTFSNYYVGSPAPWVTATLSSTTAPATLTITASPELDTSAEFHRLRFDLSAPGATNSPVTFFSINVTVVDDGITPVNATIVPSPTSLAFTVKQGQTASREITINNSGTDPLVDLTVGSFSNYFTGAPAPWVTATVSPTTAPATITVEARPDASVYPETHRLRFDVMSPGATNSPYTFFSINVTVEPGPTWSEVAPMPTPRWGVSAVALGNDIYTVGGNASPGEPYPGGPVVTTLEAYDAATDTWTTKASLPGPREHANVAAHGGRIYVFGGWQCNLCGTNTVWVYDPGFNSWSQRAPAPFNIHGGVAATIADRIYMTTASCCGSPGSTFRVYDVVSGTFSSPAPMPHPHDFPAGGGVIDGKFYVVGGYGATSYLDVYDPNTNSWTTKASLPNPRWHGTGVVMDGKLFVFGGYADNGRLDVYAYDPATDSWSTYTEIPQARNLLGAAQVGGNVYLFGGNAAESPGVPVATVDKLTP